MRERGYITAISSSTIQSIIEEYCKREGIVERLDLILGFAPGFEKGKAHFSRTCEVFDLKPSNILFVGDSLKDAERALEGQVAFIGRVGMFAPEDFAKIIPDCQIVFKLKELLNLL